MPHQTTSTVLVHIVELTRRPISWSILSIWMYCWVSLVFEATFARRWAYNNLFMDFAYLPTPGFSINQLCVIFTLPTHFQAPGLSTHLTYVEWFSVFCAHPEPPLGYALHSKSFCTAEIVPIDSIVSSYYLIPRFGTNNVPGTRPYETVLKEYWTFYFNHPPWVILE